MNLRRALALVPAVLLLSMLWGPLPAPVQADHYSARVDLAFQQSDLIGQAILVFGTFTVLQNLPDGDIVTVVLTSPDQPAAIQQFSVPPGTEAGAFGEFAIDVIAFEAGEFVLTVRSEFQNEVILRQAFPIPNHAVSVRVTPTGGGQVVANTVIDAGGMGLIFTRFDIVYTINGEVHRQSEVVNVWNSTLLALVGFPEQRDLRQWHFVQPFTLEAGEHTLQVRVIDHSVGVTVHQESFVLQVSDEIQVLQESMAEAEERLADLEGRTEGVEATAGLALPLGYVAVAALALAVLTLLIQLGVLKVRRRGE